MIFIMNTKCHIKNILLYNKLEGISKDVDVLQKKKWCFVDYEY
jgi:hypothetical protein